MLKFGYLKDKFRTSFKKTKDHKEKYRQHRFEIKIIREEGFRFDIWITLIRKVLHFRQLWLTQHNIVANKI